MNDNELDSLLREDFKKLHINEQVEFSSRLIMQRIADTKHAHASRRMLPAYILVVISIIMLLSGVISTYVPIESYASIVHFTEQAIIQSLTQPYIWLAVLFFVLWGR